MFDFFADWTVIDFTDAAAERFTSLRHNKVRISTSDLKIASISISVGATLLTANTADFERVSGLKFESWIS